MYLNDDLERLNEELSIEIVVGEYVELKKSGSNYKGLCPFHNDTSPSFMVSPSKNICKCFVCGAGGTVVSFYANYNKISILEAIKELGKKYKIKVSDKLNYDVGNKEDKVYYDIMEESHRYFQEEIFKNNGKFALDYFVKRGITPNDITENKLGYSPNQRNALGEHLLQKGFELEKIKELGLVKDGENGIYDTFRNRIIFPIYSTNKKVVAFGGRTLQEEREVAKYINSPDTPIFKKGNILYGLGERLVAVKNKNYAILMEGYMDVLMVVKNGFDVALAPLGTALTEEQGDLLKKYTSNVLISFDMDPAGQKAAERAIIILKNKGFSIRVLQLQGAKDPDEYIKKNGREGYLEVIKNSQECFDFLYQLYSKEYNLTDFFSKQNFIKRFKEFFQSTKNRVEQSLYIDKLAKNTEIEKESLWEELITKNVGKKKNNNSLEYKNNHEKINNKDAIKNRLEDKTVGLLMSSREYCKYFRKHKNELIELIIDYYDKNSKIEQIQRKELKTFESERLIEIYMYTSGNYTVEDLKELLIEWLRIEVKFIEGLMKDFQGINSRNRMMTLEIMVELKREKARLLETNTVEELEEIGRQLEKIKIEFMNIQ